ncbi:MAG: GntR family transcriptional regulator [Kiritimatiellae bacterium]|nr:GntR family transcriptional regulator [Kiritimatiellia bacterium]
MTKSVWIGRDLSQKILNGEYVDRIPSVFDLAKTYGVNFKTVSKAFAGLADLGVVECTSGRGTFVTHGGREVLLSRVERHPGEKLVAVFMPSGADVYGLLYKSMVSLINRHDRLPVIVEGLKEDALHDVLRLKPAAIVVNRGWNMFPYAMLKKREKDVGRIVFLHRAESDLHFDADYVLSDHTYGAYIATRHLLDLGRRRILYMGCISRHPAMIYRFTAHYALVQGYRLAPEESGLAGSEMFHFETEDRDGNRRRLKAILDDPAKRPTAIFADGDARLVDNYDLIREAGLRVPDDLALVGYYNLEQARQFEVPLTSVSIREEELARIAARRILDVNGPRERITVKPELIVRESCGRR